MRFLWVICGNHEDQDASLVAQTKIMASGPITSWQIDGETTETVTDFIFLDFKITVMVTALMKLKDACSLEEKL